MGRPTNEERARRAAAAFAAADPPIETKVEPASAPILTADPQIPDNVMVNLSSIPYPEHDPIVKPLVLAVPPEHYSAASAVFRRQLDGWLDEVQRQGKHRGETLTLVAPKE